MTTAGGTTTGISPPVASALTEDASDVNTGGGAPRPSGSVGVYALATVGYLGLSLIVWWQVWSGHPTSTTTCGCGDTSLFTWFLAWPAYAIAHGLNPLFSTAMFHPTGVNLLSNTGEVGIGIVLAPVTWLFGPIASLNVALTLSPVLSALAMFALLRRWVSWAPAAFIGGLAYGFSPVILISLTDGHLMVAMGPIPPLIVACLDEILVRQRRRPLAAGAVLGLLVTVQFFVGTEVLVITVTAACVGLLVIMANALWHREILRQNFRHAVVALVGTAALTVALLAYPLWFALAGPAHLSGPVWGTREPISFVGTFINDFLIPPTSIPIAGTLTHRYGGYQAPVLSGQYFGVGLVFVIVTGLVVWRRDLRLWFFAIVGAASVLLSLGLKAGYWTPWRLLVHVPLMDNIIPSRFLVVTYVCAGVMLGVIVDRVRSSIVRYDSRSSVRAAPATSVHGGPRRQGRRWFGALIGAVVAAIALVPWITYYNVGIPLTTQPVVLPTWFTKVAPTLRGHQVLLAFPPSFTAMQSAMTWQAVDRMHYSMAGGGGPNGLIARAGSEAPGQTVLNNLSIAGPSRWASPISADGVTAVREALGGWGVTTVVLPDTTKQPSYARVYQVRTIAILITAATGRRPIRQADAWVWDGVNHYAPGMVPDDETLIRCGTGPSTGSVASIDRATACIVANPSRHP